MNRLKNRAGVALFFTLATIFIISIIVSGMIYFMRGEAHLTENYVDGTVALLLAEAGVEEALFTIKSQMNDPKNPFYTMITKSSEGSVEIDLSRLEGKVRGIDPIAPGGKARAVVTWKRDDAAKQELINQGLPPEMAKEGYITINSRGTFHRSQKQVEVKKIIKACLVQSPFPGNSIGMIAPEHGLYLNKAHQDSFKILPFDFWDPWGFKVDANKVFMKEGARLDLPKWLMLTKMRNELEHPWLDMGIGWTGWNGGADLADVKEIEYADAPVTRQYNKWMGLLHWPLWKNVSNENYHSGTKQVESYEPKKVNLYPEEVYRKLANRLVDPEKKPQHGKYFTDVNFKEAYGSDEVTFRNVVPLYGWGDWRRVPNKFVQLLGNPTKAHDTSRAVEINGLTYIKGDVLLEGWVKGKGLLVVEGNVYIGGDVLMLDDPAHGKASLGIIALRDRTYDTSVETPKTGRIIYKPHHDSDWSRFGLTHPFRNVSPRMEGCFYAEGGLDLDTDSKMAKLINMEIIGNLAVDYFDRRRMPNDIKIKYFDWQKVLSQSNYDYSVDKSTTWSKEYEVAMMQEIVSWREVPASL